jgi:hypothetical protein
LRSRVDVSRVQGEFSRGMAKKENLLCPSVLGSPKKTSRGMLKSSTDCSQKQKPLKILGVNSILKEEVSYLF